MNSCEAVPYPHQPCPGQCTALTACATLFSSLVHMIFTRSWFDLLPVLLMHSCNQWFLEFCMFGKPRESWETRTDYIVDSHFYCSRFSVRPNCNFLYCNVNCNVNTEVYRPSLGFVANPTRAASPVDSITYSTCECGELEGILVGSEAEPTLVVWLFSESVASFLFLLFVNVNKKHSAW